MNMRKLAVTLLACGGYASLLAPGVAQAHISLHPNTVPAGAFVTLDVRVPGEQQGAYAYKVDMLVPPGLTDVATESVPGWSVRVISKKLAKPIQTDDGPVSEEVSQVIWTGDRTKDGRLDDGTFVQFPLSIAMPEGIAGQSLAFKTLQYYSDGKVVRWIGSPSAEFPAPTINVTAKGGVIEDVAGGEAGPMPGEHPSGAAGASASSLAAVPAKSDSNDLAVVALIVGALGLAVAVAGVALPRRRPK